MTAWIGWLLPGLLLVFGVATLVYNRRRVRAQRVGVTEERRAAPSGLVAGYAIASATRLLGIATLIAVIILLVQGRGFTPTWWAFTVTALVLTGAGFLGARRLRTALRRSRDPFE